MMRLGSFLMSTTSLTSCARGTRPPSSAALQAASGRSTAAVPVVVGTVAGMRLECADQADVLARPDRREHRAGRGSGAVVLVGHDDEGEVSVRSDETGVFGRIEGRAERADGVLVAAAGGAESRHAGEHGPDVPRVVGAHRAQEPTPAGIHATTGTEIVPSHAAEDAAISASGDTRRVRASGLRRRDRWRPKRC